MVSSGTLCRVALVRTDVSEDLSASFIRVTRIGELGTTLAVTSNRRSLRRNTKWYFGCQLQLVLFLVHRFLSLWWRRRYVLPKRRFLQEPHGVISQKTPFFIVTAVKTSNLTKWFGDFKCPLFPPEQWLWTRMSSVVLREERNLERGGKVCNVMFSVDGSFDCI
jgi:hypothetical protein